MRLLESLESRTFLSAGDLDKTFSSDGIMIDKTKTSGEGECAATMADGRMVIAGGSVVRRYAQNGNLDKTFGVSGEFRMDAQGTYVEAIAVRNDGKIAIAGETANGYKVIRLLANGKLDTSFSKDGKASVAFTGVKYSDIRGVAFDGDRIVVAGYVDNSKFNSQIAIARFKANGAVDSSFGASGIVQSFLPGDTAKNSIRGKTLLVQKDGKVVVGCQWNSGTKTLIDVAIVRFNAAGKVDKQFGNKGVVKLDLGSPDQDHIAALAADAKGRIVASCSAESENEILYRFLSNGSPDKSFGVGGKRDTGLKCTCFPTQLGFDSKNRILFVGNDSKSNDGADVFVHRYTEKGELDQTFATKGVFRTNLLGYGGDPIGLGILAGRTDKYVVAANNFSKPNFAEMFRLLAD